MYAQSVYNPAANVHRRILVAAALTQPEIMTEARIITLLLATLHCRTGRQQRRVACIYDHFYGDANVRGRHVRRDIDRCCGGA